MSRVIDMDKISEVLLADGWHTVTQINNKSTFCLEPHEYIRDRAPAAEGLQFTGATWLEEKDDAQFYCPLTAILAVKIKGQGAGITSVQQRKDRQGFWRRFHSISKPRLPLVCCTNFPRWPMSWSASKLTCSS
jgi:hypothetical protein